VDGRVEGRSRARPRGGREQATKTILDAAAQLFTERGVNGVTVRDIAQRAGVSHALVHRYLGSKEQILGAVLLRSDEKLLASAEEATNLLDAALRMLHTDREVTRQEMRLVANAATANVPFERLGIAFPATARLHELAARACAEASERGATCRLAPNVLVAGLVAMAIGWVTTRPWMPKVLGIEDPEAELQTLVTLLVAASIAEAEGQAAGESPPDASASDSPSD